MIKHARVGVMILSEDARSSYLKKEKCIHRSSVFHGKLKIKQEKYHKLMLAIVSDKQTQNFLCS